MSIQDMEDLKQQYLDEMKKRASELEQEANLSAYTTKPSRRFNFIYDDDYEESNIPLNEIISQDPPSITITHVLPIEDPEDSLIIGDEDLNTIPEKESDEVIKSSVEDFVLIQNLDEPDLLVTPLFDDNEDECFDPGDDIDKIELLLHHDPSIPNMSIASILEEFTNEPPLEDNDDLFDLESKENK
nr:hypothetical protein [Tanacetum cinerariifolium]